MTEFNLLDIVPEQLFQTHSISDIDAVQKKLQYEIQRKREELRAMVGERYRDLIQAADTIEEMKLTTSSTLNHIGEMMAACRNLHDTHLVGFKIDETIGLVDQSPQFASDPVHSIAVQVKLLMEIPEKIWTCIEAEDFVKATQLFIMARHINTGLQLQAGGSNTKPGLQSLQRLITQQWHSISNFNQTIIGVCKHKLQDIDISIEAACSCLLSLYLLDSQTMVELLNSLIELQSNSSLKSTLQFDLSEILEGDVKARIREKIVNGVKIILKTIVLVYACFVGNDNDGGAVVSKLRGIFQTDSRPLVELIQCSDQQALKILPPVVLNYRLSTNAKIEPLTRQEITSSVQKWSVWVNSFVEESVHKLLQNITRVKFLHEIREDAFKIETPSHWSSICQSLEIPEVHVWCHYFQPLLTARVKAIIDSRWIKIYESFKTQMLVDLTKASSDTEGEVDINWFAWKDLIGDTIIESRGDVVNVMNSLMKGMSHQDRGFTPNLDNLCLQLDSELQRLLEDLKIYLYQDRKASANKILFSYDEDDNSAQIYSDKSDIEMYLRDTSDANVQSMLYFIKACFQESTLQATEVQQKTTAIYTARFVQATTHLMPHLRKCYICDDPNVIGNLGVAIDDEALKRWNDLCGVLKENYLYCWGNWVEIVIGKVHGLTDGLPQEFTLEANVDYLMMQWDVITIEEKDEEGKSVESSIKVPAGPSLKLQQYLYAVSRLLDEVVPHTLPVEIHSSFIDKVTAITLEHYNKVIREKQADINQRCALQLLMDVRHLTMLLVPRECNKYVELSHEICEFLRQKIDPFDYDVFYPYIQTNLKRSVQRVQTLLGSLIMHHGQLTGIIGTKPVLSGGSGDKAAALLASGDSPWFSLLPVATPPSHLKKQEKPAKKKQIASSSHKPRQDITEMMASTLPINFANARSGAASFFNSMTSDWFSGS